jgi:hypothetical protein
MALGPGKYDDVATMAREMTKAEGVIVMVWNGNKGYGFSAQFSDPILLRRVPDILRDVADQMENDVK